MNLHFSLRRKCFGRFLLTIAPLLCLSLPAQDSAPVFVSRTGGGEKTWTTLAELTTAANRGDPVARGSLGERLLRGDGVPQDVPRALALLEQAARAGVGSAAFRLGMLLDDGLGVAQDRRRALDYFRAAAAGGVAEAFFNVGAAYAGAHGVKRDYPEGLAWFILATKRGADKEGEQSVRAHIEKLRHPELIAAAEKRAPALEAELAATTVAALLPPPAPFVVTGPVATSASDSTSSDKNSAVVTLPSVSSAANAAAAPGEPTAGPPVKLVSPTGRKLSWPNLSALERAADRGAPDAAAALGQVLLAGELMPADPLRAVNLLEPAARAGSADAAQLLAELYTKGDKIPRDDAKAFSYNLQAARGGSLQGMFNTGALYANGRDTTRDYTAALSWLIAAQHYGADQAQAAKRIRAQLEKTAPAQIPVAEKQAADLLREIEAVLANPSRP